MPLAPRKEFARLGEPGCAFIFTDAARELGSGFGGFSVVQKPGATFFYYMTERWDDVTRAQLMSNVLSMPAGEAYGGVALADALAVELQTATHMIIFTDSSPFAAAVTTGNSISPQCDEIVQWLFLRHNSTQFLGVHQKGIRNVVADALSRGRGDEFVTRAIECGMRAERLRPRSGANTLLQRAADVHQRHA